MTTIIGITKDYNHIKTTTTSTMKITINKYTATIISNYTIFATTTTTTFADV